MCHFMKINLVSVSLLKQKYIVFANQSWEAKTESARSRSHVTTIQPFVGAKSFFHSHTYSQIYFTGTEISSLNL